MWAKSFIGYITRRFTGPPKFNCGKPALFSGSTRNIRILLKKSYGKSRRSIIGMSDEVFRSD
jgi:hypothetical protein